MGYKFCPILNYPRKAGLTCRVVNNGTTGTVSWSGFNLLALDPDGVYSVETSDDRTSWTQAVSEAATESTTATTPALGNPGVAKYFRVRALDQAELVVYATSNVVTVIRQNSPVTGLAIVSAADDGSGTSFSLEYTCTEPATYTDTYVRVEVTVEDLTVYSEEFAFDDGAIEIIDDLPGIPGDDVAILVTVLGRTGVLGAASEERSAVDVVASSEAPEGEDFVAYQESLGYTFPGGHRQAYKNWFNDNFDDGILTKIAEAWFFLFNNNTYNRSLAFALTNGTFTPTATAASDRVTFSSSGFFAPGRTLLQYGVTYDAVGMAFVYPTSISVGTGADFKVQESGTNYVIELTPRYDNSGSKGYFRFGNSQDGVNAFEAVDTDAYGAAGMWVGSRSSASVANVKYYDWTTISSVSSTSGFSGTTFPAATNVLEFGAWSGSGQYTNRPFSLGLMLKGLSSAEIDLLMVNTETLLTALGAI